MGQPFLHVRGSVSENEPAGRLPTFSNVPVICSSRSKVRTDRWINCRLTATKAFLCSSAAQCGCCSGIETENIFAANRGCCFYFPQYTLIDLRTVAAIDPGFIDALQANPNSVIHEDHLVVHGFYNQAAHDVFRLDAEARDQKKYQGFDTSLQFRKCAFCTEAGCSIAFRLRPHPCNLYLCRGVIDRCSEPYRAYSRERKDYFAYCHYMNEILADELAHRGLSLTADFTGSIAALIDTPIDTFEFADLAPIRYN